MYAKEVHQKAKAAWISGKTLTEIAREMGVTYSALVFWRTKEGWDAEKDRIEYDAECREIERLTVQREDFKKRSLELWEFLYAQMFLRAGRYGVETEMPMAEAIDMAKVVAACQVGYQMALGIDPKAEAKANEVARPRRVMIDYTPLADSLSEEYGSLAEAEAVAAISKGKTAAGGNGGNGHGDSHGNSHGNGHSNGHGAGPGHTNGHGASPGVGAIDAEYTTDEGEQGE